MIGRLLTGEADPGLGIRQNPRPKSEPSRRPQNDRRPINRFDLSLPPAERSESGAGAST